MSSATPWPSRVGLQNTLIVSLVQRSKTYPTSVLIGHKKSDGEAPVMLKLWGMQCTPSLLLLPGPLWPGVVGPDRIVFHIETMYLC